MVAIREGGIALTRGLRREFFKEVHGLGLKIKKTTGKSEFKPGKGTIYINWNTANNGTFVDEFSHAFGFATGRGKGSFLPSDVKPTYAYLLERLSVVKHTNKLKDWENTLYHQLELLNLMKGLKDRYPGFIKSIPADEITGYLDEFADLL